MTRLPGFLAALLLFPDAVPAGTKTLACEEETGSATRYCLFHNSSSGLFGRSYQLVIGIDPARGLFFGIPWDADQVEAEFDRETGQLAVKMPGTRLSVERAEYLDKR